MVTIRHVFWGLRGRSDKNFVPFSRPSTATDWAKTCPMVVRPVVDDDFSLPAAKSTQICALTSMGPKCQRHWRSFFSRSRTCLSFPGRAVYDSRTWVPDVSLTKRENIEFLDSFSPLISGYSALTSIPAPLLNVEGGCRLMGPRCQPHKTRIFWFLPLFFTTDIWLLDFKYQSLPPC